MQTRHLIGARTLSTDVSYECAADQSCLRVLHVLSYLGRGGTEHVVLNLIAGLGDHQFEQRICTTRGYDPQFVRLHGLESKLHVAGRSEPTFQFPLFRLTKIMRLFKPHIVHSRNWGGLEAVFAARLAGVPTIIHSEHGYDIENVSGLPLRRRLFRRAAYGIVDCIFAVTKELRDYHARAAWLPPERIRVLYNGVDTHRFAPRPELRIRLRKEFGWNTHNFVAGTVGRVASIKDQATFLRAAEQLIESGIDVHILLVGDGPQMEMIRRQIGISLRLSARVRLVGASEHTDELLNAMDVFVLPSLMEGMSNTLLEAMATNLPVVATDVGGNPEIVEHERSGLLFRPRDVNGLVQRLTELAHDPALRRLLGCAARQRVVANFSIERMIKNYQNLYLETAAFQRQMARTEG